jgi:beta-N-acetylhexosaminidase
MSLNEKLGQLLMLPYYGSFTSEQSPEFLELQRQVEQNHIGGLMLHTRMGPFGVERSEAYPAAAVANLLQRRAKIPLLVSGDFERGTAMRIREGTSFPHAMAVAATGRPEDAYTVGRITALEARAVGAPLIFAPVADVNSNPANPIINIRSFGEDPKRVGEFVAAYIRGVEENGALATAKHFPGHGDTNIDSHLDLPAVCLSREHLDRFELPPFLAAISAGASAMMTGHLAVPALEPDANVPATLSEQTATWLLRREMKFHGLAVTDGLMMGGVTVRYPPAEAAVRAVLAGCDILLFPPEPDAALAGLRWAAEMGRLPLSRIDDAVTRILRAKVRAGLDKTAGVNLEELARSFGRPEFAQAAQDIADRGVTLLRDTAQLLPLDATRPTRTLLIAIAGDRDRQAGADFESELRWRVDSLQTLRFDTHFAPIAGLKLPPPDSYDVMIVGIFVRVADRKGHVGLPEEQIAAVKQLLALNKPVIVVCFGNPYLVSHFCDAKTWLAVFSPADVAQRAAARAIFGQVAIGGRFPVTVPGAASIGEGLDVAASSMRLAPAVLQADAKLAEAYTLLDRAVTDGAFPGGALAVGYRGILAAHAFGSQTYGATSAPVTPETIYDAASLTKAVVTTTLVAMLDEAGQIDVDAPVARYLPVWALGANADWRARVTLRHLLTHTSGLPPHRDYFRNLRKRPGIVHHVLAEPLSYEPGAQSVYSDLDFILLGQIVEELTGKPLDQLAHERIFLPLGMSSTCFNPPKSLRARIAPTEEDKNFRKRLLHGEVHDENAWAMGGVAGHAGMFSTAPNLAVFCQMLLNGGIYAHRRLLRRETVRQFTTADPLSGSARTLGWMVPTPDSTSGKYFSPRSFGHLSFTGGSIWVDPEKELFVVLLTNRVHPTRDNDQMPRLRRSLHNAIVEGLGLAGRS